MFVPRRDLGDEPLPKPGQVDVIPKAQEWFLHVSHLQEQKGRQKYGTTLQTFNGRDATVDAMQDLVDVAHYLTQEQIEKHELAYQLSAALGRIEELTREVDKLRLVIKEVKGAGS
jgi:hypothetical protein